MKEGQRTPPPDVAQGVEAAMQAAELAEFKRGQQEKGRTQYPTAARFFESLARPANPSDEPIPVRFSGTAAELRAIEHTMQEKAQEALQALDQGKPEDAAAKLEEIYGDFWHAKPESLTPGQETLANKARVLHDELMGLKKAA